MCLCVSVCVFVYLWWVSFPHTDPCCLVSFFFSLVHRDRKDENRLQCVTSVVVVLSPDCGINLRSSRVFFRSLALSWGVFPLALARTHAHTVTCTHNIYVSPEDDVILGTPNFPSGFFFLHCTVEFFPSRVWIPGPFFPGVANVSKTFEISAFLLHPREAAGGFFKSLRLWMLHLHF